MAETLLWSIVGDITSVGVVLGFMLLIYSKVRKKTIKESVSEIFSFGKKDE